ncbi:helix-turn-helix domain-containing protein [Streptomyces sp. RGM 3693]|uniref:helix-turn-helix domain-containing protein n=1 Tax=Streptomyces sp. RGM 3693 TaxID=3413284 RepID=UPI003D2A797E
MPYLYEECGRLLSGSGGVRERTSGGPLPGMPFNTAATEVRSRIVVTLASWGGLVAQERSVAAPARTVPSLARWLVGQVEWLAAHPAGGEFSVELQRLVRAAHRVTSPGGARRVPVGACVESGCAGTLVARTGGAAAGLAEIRCDADAGHRWAECEWGQLRGRMTPAGAGGRRRTQWLSPQDVSRIWRVSMGSVYRLASENAWGRRRVGGRSYYDEADVRRTLSARLAGHRAR